MNKFILKIIFLSIFIFATPSLFSREGKIEISGLRIFTQDFLIKKLNLSRKNNKNIIKSIRRFYIKNGYTLVRIYKVKSGRKILKLFINEGILGRIIFLNINTYEIIKMKYEFKLKLNVFNKFQIKEIFWKIKKNNNYNKITYKIIKVKKHDKSLLQLDGNFTIPVIDKNKIPFLNSLGAEYNLEIRIKTNEGNRLKSGIAYKINANIAKGVVPGVKYYYNNFIVKKDMLECGAFIGFMYLFDKNYKDLPRFTFFTAMSTYYFAPMLKEYFTPKVLGKIYISSLYRNDMGLEKLNYNILKSILSPGITLFKKLKFYTAFGVVRVDYSKIEEIQDNSFHNEVNIDYEYFYTTGGEIRLELIPIRLGNITDKNFIVKYNYFVNHKNFHILSMKSHYDFELERKDIISSKINYGKIWKDNPFIYDLSVSNIAFRGFIGKEHYSNHLLAIGNEYLFSIYRDMFYCGPFIDYTVFNGLEYVLTGIQSGIAGGISSRFIIFSQFELRLFLGQDYLFSDTNKQYNALLRLNKKW